MIRSAFIPIVVAVLSAATGCGHRGSSALIAEGNVGTVYADGESVIHLALRSKDGRAVDLSKVKAQITNARGHGEASVTSTPPELLYRAGVLPGVVEIVLNGAGVRTSKVHLTVQPVSTDRYGDGEPDFMRLDDAVDRDAFRRWFTLIAERQALADAVAQPEIKDCAALVRYSYREALRRHDAAWASAQGLGEAPALADVRKYQYPYTPLGANLFRTTAGRFTPQELTGGEFAEFADARTLLEANTLSVGRDVNRARPGDLLFFRQFEGNPTYHSMIFIGGSHFGGAGRWLVYHTGPDKKWPGEIRRVEMDTLLHHPDPRWRPVVANPNFLGVYRWKILREAD